MDFIKEFFSKEIVKSILFFIGVGIFIYLIRSILNLVLLTFLFTYLINSLEDFVIRNLSKYIPIKKGIVTIILYILIITLIVVVVYKYLPIIVGQTLSIIKHADYYYKNIIDSLPEGIAKYVVPLSGKINFKNYTQSGVDTVLHTATNLGKASLDVFFALMLSLFYVLEKDKVSAFVKKFGNSRVSGIYEYCRHYGSNFLNSFGKVIKAQIVIAIVNTTLSVLFLAIFGFKKLFALGFMIFVLSLIPVAGVIISLIPLSFIAFDLGGIVKVIDVLIMILIIHCIESYFLNPKLMAQNTKLPIFFTFVVLIVSEHFMGIWGLLLGIPLFIFLLDVLGVKYLPSEQSKKVFSKKKKIEDDETKNK